MMNDDCKTDVHFIYTMCISGTCTLRDHLAYDSSRNKILTDHLFNIYIVYGCCTTTELSKLLTSCLTAIKSHVIRYCETVYETSNKNWFWSIKNSGEVLSKLKCRGFRATSLSTYDFSTLYTTLPHTRVIQELMTMIPLNFILNTCVLLIY